MLRLCPEEKEVVYQGPSETGEFEHGENQKDVHLRVRGPVDTNLNPMTAGKKGPVLIRDVNQMGKEVFFSHHYSE